jgi:hypothetical protein
MATVPGPERIERDAETRMDALDRRLLRGDLTPAAYDAEVKKLDRWATRQHQRHAAHRAARAWAAPDRRAEAR